MRKPLLLSIAITVLVVGGSVAAYIALTTPSNESASVSNMTAEQAIEEAESFHPPDGMMCISAMTPAVHAETGASYTFPNGCLPSGWTHDVPHTTLSEENNDTPVTEGEPRTDTPQSDGTPAALPDPSTTVDNPPASQPDPAPSLSDQERAIAKARAYQPPKNTMCTTVMTPALHVETGARYTFGYGCLPPGWIAQRSNEL